MLSDFELAMKGTRQIATKRRSVKLESATKRRSDEATQGNAPLSAPSSRRRFVAPSLLSPTPSSLRRFVAPSLISQSPSSLISSRSGFSFAEVLFAVIVLGIGFIMIAAVFPVAITQSKATKGETTTAAVAQQGVQLLQQAGQWDAAAWQWDNGGGTTENQPFLPPGKRRWSDTSLPHTFPFYSDFSPLPFYVQPAVETSGLSLRGRMKPLSLRDPNPYVRRTAELLRSSRASLSDPRFAWVAFYRRDVTLHRNFADVNNRNNWREVPSNFAQVIVMGVLSQGEGRPTFNVNTYKPGSPGVLDPDSDVYQGYAGSDTTDMDLTTLDPKPVRIVIQRANANDPVARVSITALQAGDPFYDSRRSSEYPLFPQAIDTGCFLVIGDDQIRGPLDTGSAISPGGYLNGRVYRVGAYIGKNGAADEFELSPDGDLDPVDRGVDGLSGTNPATGFNDDIYSIGIDDSRSDVQFKGPAIAFAVGKPMLKRDDVTQGFSGAIMDVSVYSTFIQVK